MLALVSLGMSTTCPLELASRQHFTLAGERDGSLDRSLAAETVADLTQAYLDSIQSSDGANQVFGGNSRRWQHAIGRELRRRLITRIKITTSFDTWYITVRTC
jgi:hypothetical protein